MSNTYAFPYLGRIMGRLPGHDPIELFRPERGMPVYPTEVTSYRRNMDPAWTIWVETTTNPRHLLSDRPHKMQALTRTSLRGAQIPHDYVKQLETEEQSVALQITPANEL